MFKSNVLSVGLSLNLINSVNSGNETWLVTCVLLSMVGDTSQWWLYNRLADSEDTGLSDHCYYAGLVHVACQSS